MTEVITSRLHFISWQLTVVLLVTGVFWWGVFIWLDDGAWKNGALPTHAIYHMAAGLIGCWLSFLYLLNLKKKTVTKDKK